MAVSDEKIRAALLAFDKDADGQVLPNEVILSQLSLGVFLQPEERNKFDEKASAGVMDYDKAANLIQSVTRGRQPADDLTKMFAPFDTQKDGTVSTAEFRAVLQNLGEILSEPQIDEIINKFNTSSRIEYKKLIEYLLE